MSKQTTVTVAPTILRKFVDKAKDERIKMGLTIQQFADATGLGAGWMTRFEKYEEKNPTVNTLERIAEALGMTFVLDMIE